MWSICQTSGRFTQDSYLSNHNVTSTICQRLYQNIPSKPHQIIISGCPHISVVVYSVIARSQTNCSSPLITEFVISVVVYSVIARSQTNCSSPLITQFLCLPILPSWTLWKILWFFFMTGVKNMAKAYVSQPGHHQKESLVNVKCGYKECTQVRESPFNTVRGIFFFFLLFFFFTLKGIFSSHPVWAGLNFF